MKQKEILVMTSFGPVPFNVIKDYINPEVAKLIEKNKEKIITEVEEQIPLNLDYYVGKLAERKNLEVKKVEALLNRISTINFSSVFQILLREVAIELDKKYPDHIEESEEIYGVSLTNGHIFKMDKKFIKNFRNFAAFRTANDAKLACKITRNLLKVMFKSDTKE